MKFKFGKENIVCGCSDLSYGTLVFLDDVLKEKVIKNRHKFFTRLGIRLENTVFAGLAHGSKVSLVTEKDRGKGAFDSNSSLANIDGMVTSTKNTFLIIGTADCFPVFFYDPKKKVVGLAHAGWPGVLSLVCQKLVKVMQRNFDSDSKDLQVLLGPGIRSCCYDLTEVPERLKKFSDVFEKEVIKVHNNKFFGLKNRKFLDIISAIKIQLTGVGVLPENIQDSKICTCCEHDKYPSCYYTREISDKRKPTKRRMLSVIGIIRYQ